MLVGGQDIGDVLDRLGGRGGGGGGDGRVTSPGETIGDNVKFAGDEYWLEFVHQCFHFSAEYPRIVNVGQSRASKQFYQRFVVNTELE